MTQCKHVAKILLNNVSRRLTILCLTPLLSITILKLHIWKTSPIDIYGLNQPKVTILAMFAFVLMIALSPEKFFSRVPRLSQNVALAFLLLFIAIMDKNLVLHSHADKFSLYKNPILILIAVLVATYLSSNKHVKYSRALQIFSIAGGIFWALNLASYLVIDERHPYLYNWVNLQLVIHPIIQTSMGKTSFIDMHSQYGGYALILDPLFSLIGVSLLKITSVFAVIFLISLLSIYLILNKLCKNPLFALAGFLGTTYLMMYAFFMWPFEKYYQVYPIRLFFPIISTVLILYSSKIKIKTFLILAAILSMLAIYWNPETGVTLAIAFLAFICVKWGTNNWRRAILPASIFLAELSLLIAGFKIMIDLTHTGSLSFQMMFRSMFLYLSGTEINSLKIWSLVLFVYGLSFVYSVSEMRRIESQARADLDVMLYLGLLGMGLLVYHLNNMNEASLACVIWPCGILLTLLIDWNFKEDPVGTTYLRGKKFSKTKVSADRSMPYVLQKLNLRHLVLVFFIYLTVCALAIQLSQSVKDEERLWDLSDSNSQKQLFNDIDPSGNPMFVTVSNQIAGRMSTPAARISFVKTIATQETQDDLLILSQWDSILYLHANAKAPVSWPNWYIAYFDYEFNEAYRKLSDGSIRRVVIDEIPGALGHPYKLHAPGLDEKMLEIIRSRFTLVQKLELPMAYSGYVAGNWAKTNISLYELR